VAEARYAMARSKALMAGREPPPPPEDLRRQGRHDEPPVALDDRGAPVYAGGQPFYGGGWFGAGSGLFGGLLLGSMLGGWGRGGPIVIDHGDGETAGSTAAATWGAAWAGATGAATSAEATGARTPAVLPAPEPSTPSDRLRARASSRFDHVRQESLPPVHLGRVG
jgi:hypothetical protein